MISSFGSVSHDLQHEYWGPVRGLSVIPTGDYASTDTWSHQQFSPDDRARAEHTMERLGVAELQDRTFAAMSTGEQRRFLLGCALISDPESLLLDESTTGFDLILLSVPRHRPRAHAGGEDGASHHLGDVGARLA